LGVLGNADSLWEVYGSTELGINCLPPVLSFACLAELHYGAAAANWGERRRQCLEEAIRRLQTNDLWVCTTAVYHNAPLLTANLRHFENFPGLTLLT
jgi:tRNA(fMet)-specific endonuclease VapC